MNTHVRRLFLATLLLGGCPLYSQDIRHFGIGINYGGAQIDWRVTPKWMFETRAQFGSDHSNENVETTSSIVGLRTYRLFPTANRFLPFCGLEAAAIGTKQKNTNYSADGISAGAFFGLGTKLSTHFVLNVDAGPYFIQLKEKRTHADKTEVDLVGDAALIFFF